MWPPVLAAVVAVLVHLLCLGPIVDALQFDGAACSLLVAHGCMLLTLVLYILVRRPHDAATWPGWRLCQVARDGRGMKSFIQTSLAGLVALSEWVFWEVICFRCGTLGTTALAIHSVAYTIVPLAFMVPLGLSMALSMGVGNAIGEGNVQHARRIAFFAFMTGVFLAVCTGITAYLLRTPFILAFTDDEDVIAGARQIWPIVSLVMMPCDAVFAIAGGLLRGLGLNRRSAASVVVALWCVGLPLVFAGARTVYDVWLVMMPTYAILDIGMVASALVCVSWQRLSDDVRDRHSLAGEDGARATAPSSSSSSSSSSVEMANADTHAADSGVLLHVTADAAGEVKASRGRGHVGED